MAHQVTKKNVLMIVIGIISIIGLFSYTWIHSGNLLARYIDPPFIGFLAAAGIELSIIGLSMRIGELKKSGLNYRYFAFTLIAVVVVSAAANIAEGFYVRYNEALTVANIGRLDLIEAVILLGATGLISLVTLALSELIGQDVVRAQKLQKKQEAVDGGYTVLTNSDEPRIEELPKVELPSLPPAPSSSMTDEEFAARMGALGNGAPQTVKQVEEEFHLSHATAQRRLSNYRKAKSS